jgi:hypothetical protein
MKKPRGILVIAALALVLALSAGARGAMYLEAYLGGTAASGLGGGAPTVIGGWRVGTWFVPEGALGLKYPKWMQYLGFYTDISLHGLNANISALQGNGNVATWAFMPVVRLGFIKDDEVPFGRLQPYLGVGPGVFLVRFDNFNSSKVSTALVMDAGVRYMFNKRFSLDLCFRYRHAQQDVIYNLFSGMAGIGYHF